MAGDNILVFYPHNFYEMSSGTHRRVYNLFSYLKKNGFSMDLLSINGFTNRWPDADLRRRDIFNSIMTCEWRYSFRDKISLKNPPFRLQNHAIHKLRKEFRKLAESREYSFALINYVYWAALADEVLSSVLKVIDIHDFITLNEYQSRGGGEFKLGMMFEDEIHAISRFDYALSISEEETLVLSPFCPNTRFVNVPVSFPAKFAEKERAYDYDLLFVGSDNLSNRNGMTWFMEKVYPLLPPNLRIAVVGKICDFVEQRKNIITIPYARELDEIYNKSRVVFCPLRSGTGLKIKVVEALSFSKPAVTTSWGLSGILQKQGNGCILADSEHEFAKAILLLLSDEGKYQNLKREAEEFFMKHYSDYVAHSGIDSVFIRK